MENLIGNHIRDSGGESLVKISMISLISSLSLKNLNSLVYDRNIYIVFSFFLYSLKSLFGTRIKFVCMFVCMYVCKHIRVFLESLRQSSEIVGNLRKIL